MSELILRHFTSEKKWDMIQKSKYLLPRSSLMENSEAEKFSLPLDFRAGIVCIPTYAIDAWDYYGLLDYVRIYTTGEVALDFSPSDPKQVLVRDHSVNSPKYYKDIYNSDLFGQSFFPLFDNFFSREENAIVNSQLKKYFKSTISLDMYKNNYAVPEMWVLHSIPLSEIKRID